MSADKAPAGLGREGRAAWRRLNKSVTWTEYELDLLLEFCRNLDTLAALREALKGQPMIVHSPQAGPVANRLLAEIRAVQESMRKLSEALGFAGLAADEAAEAAGRPARLPARPPAGLRDRRSHRRAS